MYCTYEIAVKIFLMWVHILYLVLPYALLQMFAIALLVNMKFQKEKSCIFLLRMHTWISRESVSVDFSYS